MSVSWTPLDLNPIWNEFMMPAVMLGPDSYRQHANVNVRYMLYSSPAWIAVCLFFLGNSLQARGPSTSLEGLSLRQNALHTQHPTTTQSATSNKKVWRAHSRANDYTSQLNGANPWDPKIWVFRVSRVDPAYLLRRLNKCRSKTATIDGRCHLERSSRGITWTCYSFRDTRTIKLMAAGPWERLSYIHAKCVSQL